MSNIVEKPDSNKLFTDLSGLQKKDEEPTISLAAILKDSSDLEKRLSQGVVTLVE